MIKVLLKAKKNKSSVKGFFFYYYQVSLGIIWHLIIYKYNKKTKRYSYAWHTRQRPKINILLSCR